MGREERHGESLKKGESEEGEELRRVLCSIKVAKLDMLGCRIGAVGGWMERGEGGGAVSAGSTMCRSSCGFPSEPRVGLEREGEYMEARMEEEKG